MVCITYDLSDTLLKGRREAPKPQNPRPKQVLELLGDSHVLLPAGNSWNFFQQLSMPCTSFGNFGSCGNAETLQTGSSLAGHPLWGGPLRWAQGLLPLVPSLGSSSLLCPSADERGYSLCHQHPRADAVASGRGGG